MSDSENSESGFGSRSRSPVRRTKKPSKYNSESESRSRSRSPVRTKKLSKYNSESESENSESENELRIKRQQEKDDEKVLEKIHEIIRRYGSRYVHKRGGGRKLTEDERMKRMKEEISKKLKLLKDPNNINLKFEYLEENLLHRSIDLESIKVVEILLDLGANPNVPGAYDLLPLEAALNRKNKAVMKLLIAKGADPNQLDKNGENILVKCIDRNLDLLKFLVENGVNINNRNLEGRTALHEAAALGKTETVKFLVSKGAKVNVSDRDGNTPLTESIQLSKNKVADFLLDHGSDPNVTTFDGSTPLLKASIGDNIKLVRKLLSLGADPNVKDEDGNTPLIFAARKDNLEMVKLFVELELDVNAKNKESETSLSFAVEKENEEMIKFLLKSGADPNVGYTIFAAVRAKFKIFKLIIQAGGNINHPKNEHNSLLIIAINTRKNENAMFLIEKGADVNGTGITNMTPLMYAAKKGSSGLVEYLISKGADVNAIDNDGRSVLFHAIRGKSLKTINLLLSLGVNVNIRDKDGTTPLNYAIDLKLKSKITKFLLENGANPNIPDEKGFTPLHNTVNVKSKYGIDNAELLISYGAQIDTVSIKGYTPLSSAVWGQKSEFVKFLLDNGANPNSTGNKIPLFIATRNEDFKTVKMLLAHGANPDVYEKENDNSTYFIFLLWRVFFQQLNLEIILTILPKIDLNVYSDDTIMYKLYNTRMFMNKLHRHHPEFNLLKYMMDLGADPNLGKRKVLKFAISNIRVEDVRILLEYGADLNTFNYQNNLEINIERGAFEIVRLLLEHGAIIKFNVMKIYKRYKKGSFMGSDSEEEENVHVNVGLALDFAMASLGNTSLKALCVDTVYQKGFRLTGLPQSFYRF